MTVDDIIDTYAALYASYILIAAHTGYEIANSMIRILPGGIGYNTITKLSDNTLKLTIYVHEIIIPVTEDDNEIVTVLIDNLPCVTWDHDDVFWFLIEHHIYPEWAEMLDETYLRNWCKYIDNTYIFYDPYALSLANKLKDHLE